MFNKTQFRKELFWDIDAQTLDFRKNADFIIERVLSFGDEKDYQILKQIYTFKKIKKVALKADYPDKKTANFWSVIFNIPLNSFLWSKKLLMPKPNAFWKRYDAEKFNSPFSAR